MDEDWRNTFGILMYVETCDSADAGICDGAPSTCSNCLLIESIGQGDTWWYTGWYESVHFVHVQRHFHYENMPIQKYWKFHHQKNENFQMKNSEFFLISAQNIDCGYSLEPPGCEAVLTGTHNLSFWAEIRKIMYTPVNPSCTIKKWSLRGSKLYRHVFVMFHLMPPIYLFHSQNNKLISDYGRFPISSNR